MRAFFTNSWSGFGHRCEWVIGVLPFYAALPLVTHHNSFLRLGAQKRASPRALGPPSTPPKRRLFSNSRAFGSLSLSLPRVQVSLGFTHQPRFALAAARAQRFLRRYLGVSWNFEGGCRLVRGE